MSSMRNAVQRRNHRERGQPEERMKWGLLEKHKVHSSPPFPRTSHEEKVANIYQDYSLRAADHNRKKSALKALKQKALDRNPDEFYHGMLSRHLDTGIGKNKTGTVDGDRGNQVLGVEAVRLLKTQDLGYLRTQRNLARKEVETLERRMVGIKGEGRKIVWVEGVENQEVRADSDSSSEKDGEDDEDMSEELATKDAQRRAKEAAKVEARLIVAKERLKALTEAEQALDLQRAKMAKSLTVGGINKNGIKFRVRDRKR